MDVTAIVACQGTSPSPRTRYGVPEPRVSAPTTTPVATPRPRSKCVATSRTAGA